MKRFMVSGILLLLIFTAVACSSSAPSVQRPEPAKPVGTPSPAPVTIPVPVQKSDPSPASNPRPDGLIKAKWIDAQVEGSTVAIPVDEVKSNWDTHFKIQVNGNTENFMAYYLNGTIFVRANVCPPCRSIGFSLDKDTLVCDRCATVFNASTGEGIKGACVNYPKASVKFKIVDGNIIMDEADLANAYQDTLKPG